MDTLYIKNANHKPAYLQLIYLLKNWIERLDLSLYLRKQVFYASRIISSYLKNKFISPTNIVWYAHKP